MMVYPVDDYWVNPPHAPQLLILRKRVGSTCTLENLLVKTYVYAKRIVRTITEVGSWRGGGQRVGTVFLSDRDTGNLLSKR